MKKILFLGDSITEGRPGIPYVDIIQEEMKDYECINMGKGGDTVSSLYKRIRKIELKSYDAIVLFVGVNDVYGKLTWQYKILKTLMKQKWARNPEIFRDQYKTLIEHIVNQNTKLLIVSPLILGEFNNNWNDELQNLVSIVEHLAASYKKPFVNVHQKFMSYLDGKDCSNFLPTSIVDLNENLKLGFDKEKIKVLSESRGLHVTIDGVHLNQKGAEMIAESITNEIKKTT